jgi:hypothetical protein
VPPLIAQSKISDQGIQGKNDEYEESDEVF